MPVSGSFRTTRWSLLVAVVCCLPVSVGAEELPLADDAAAAPFSLQYSIQSGDRLLAPIDRDAPQDTARLAEAVQLATHWEPASDSSSAEPHEPAKGGSTPASSEVDVQDANQDVEGLFHGLTEEGSTTWSTTLDSQAEDRVESAIRSTGFAVLVLGLALVGFLGWHRVKGSKLSAPVETSELLERGRLPITQTCRLHLVRAGNCDVLVAVDRGSVRAMTPLPGDFSQLTAMPFDTPSDSATYESR